MTRKDLEESYLGAYYLERFSVIHKISNFEFISDKENVFMIAPNKWIISSPKPFSTTVQCGTIFTSLNLKQTTILEISVGCSMHLCTIWPRS
jgi:hypothetical protein